MHHVKLQLHAPRRLHQRPWVEEALLGEGQVQEGALDLLEDAQGLLGCGVAYERGGRRWDREEHVQAPGLGPAHGLAALQGVEPLDDAVFGLDRVGPALGVPEQHVRAAPCPIDQLQLHRPAPEVLRTQLGARNLGHVLDGGVEQDSPEVLDHEELLEGRVHVAGAALVLEPDVADVPAFLVVGAVEAPEALHGRRRFAHEAIHLIAERREVRAPGGDGGSERREGPLRRVGRGAEGPAAPLLSGRQGEEEVPAEDRDQVLGEGSGLNGRRVPLEDLREEPQAALDHGAGRRQGVLGEAADPLGGDLGEVRQIQLFGLELHEVLQGVKEGAARRVVAGQGQQSLLEGVHHGALQRRHGQHQVFHEEPHPGGPVLQQDGHDELLHIWGRCQPRPHVRLLDELQNHRQGVAEEVDHVALGVQAQLLVVDAHGHAQELVQEASQDALGSELGDDPALAHGVLSGERRRRGPRPGNLVTALDGAQRAPKRKARRRSSHVSARGPGRCGHVLGRVRPVRRTEGQGHAISRGLEDAVLDDAKGHGVARGSHIERSEEEPQDLVKASAGNEPVLESSGEGQGSLILELLRSGLQEGINDLHDVDGLVPGRGIDGLAPVQRCRTGARRGGSGDCFHGSQDGSLGWECEKQVPDRRHRRKVDGWLVGLLQLAVNIVNGTQEPKQRTEHVVHVRHRVANMLEVRVRGHQVVHSRRRGKLGQVHGWGQIRDHLAPEHAVFPDQHMVVRNTPRVVE
mmetsp:Transcript_22907/g.66651  ORF Transcript_22907/g.66651 Transcript_22907/m.66651 type:complete len:744 (-) Transcript_22907:880-3111(-)